MTVEFVGQCSKGSVRSVSLNTLGTIMPKDMKIPTQKLEMTMDFLKPRLLKIEADIARQAFTNGIEYFFNPQTGCSKCIEIGGGGCPAHSQIINVLRNLRRRFSFKDLMGAV